MSEEHGKKDNCRKDAEELVKNSPFFLLIAINREKDTIAQIRHSDGPDAVSDGDLVAFASKVAEEAKEFTGAVKEMAMMALYEKVLAEVKNTDETAKMRHREEAEPDADKEGNGD